MFVNVHIAFNPEINKRTEYGLKKMYTALVRVLAVIALTHCCLVFAKPGFTLQ